MSYGNGLLLLDVKPSPEPILTYCHLNPKEQNSENFESKYEYFLQENVVCKVVAMLFNHASLNILIHMEPCFASCSLFHFSLDENNSDTINDYFRSIFLNGEVNQRYEFTLAHPPDIYVQYKTYWAHHQTSNISLTKSQKLNISCLALQFSLSNPLKPVENEDVAGAVPTGYAPTTFYCLLRCVLYTMFDSILYCT